jgi:PAS domain S-box-containing protein
LWSGQGRHLFPISPEQSIRTNLPPKPTEPTSAPQGGDLNAFSPPTPRVTDTARTAYDLGGPLYELHQQVLEARVRYAALFNLLPDPCLVTDENGVIEEANAAAAELFGVSAKLLPTKHLTAFLGTHERGGFRASVAAAAGDIGIEPWNIQLHSADGRVLRIEANVAALESRGGGKRALCWLLRDVSWRRETEESMSALNRVLNARVAQRTRELELALEAEQAARRDAEAANRIKSELFARLSHEFRTPLHAVSGYLEILQQNIHGGLTLDQRRDIDRIHQAQDHLLALVNMILDFAKLEGGPVELSMAEIPVEETLRSAESLVAPQFGKKGIMYSHRPGDPTVSVFADREKVQQIVVNLLANGMKFTQPGGAVDVEWRVEGETLLVRIRDTGPGIPDDMVEKIFEPFVQLRSPGSPPTGGTGLGLPISRDLARAMGGDVEVSSTVGVGSVFTLSLPLRRYSTGSKLSAP